MKLRWSSTFSLVGVMALAACQSSSDDDFGGQPDAGPVGGQPDAQTTAPDATTPPPTSSFTAAPVRFKGGERLRADWARALDLAPTEVCQELGAYDCVGEVHRIVLGGVEPYVLGVRESLPEAPTTAPLAVDRVALSACTKAVDRDLGEPETAVIFRDPEGGWEASARRASLERLVERLLFRSATDDDLDLLDELHGELGADVLPRDWAIASCFVVATSLESLFY